MVPATQQMAHLFYAAFTIVILNRRAPDHDIQDIQETGFFVLGSL